MAVDLNPSQLACLELRCAAISGLEYGECLGFMGVNDNRNRLETYVKLKNGISEGARNFWDANPSLLGHGIMHA